MKPSTSIAPICTEARVALIDSVMVIAIPVNIYAISRVSNAHPVASSISISVECQFRRILSDEFTNSSITHALEVRRVFDVFVSDYLQADRN